MNPLTKSILYEFERGHRKGYFQNLRKRDKKEWFLRLADVLIDMKKRHILYLDPRYYGQDYELKTWETTIELLENLTDTFEKKSFFDNEGLYFAELFTNILSTNNTYYGEPNAILDYIEEYVHPEELIDYLKGKESDVSKIETVWRNTSRI